MKSLSVLGTSSNAGKTWITVALCAWLRRQGVRVAPFKAQNMSNNAWATLDGGEMARAQAVQAEACGLLATADMNPILLKPTGPQGSQLVVLGRAQGHQAAKDYYAEFNRLWRIVADTLDSWRTRCDVLVQEGAGSPVELNLMDRDLVNLRPMRHLDGRFVLVGDIDRGGIYAQLAGTWALLPAEDRARSLGAIVNRFRGDIGLFPNPQQWLAPHAPGLDVLGTVPFRPDLQPEEEDGLTAADEQRGSGELIAWMRLPHASNLTDCQPWWDDTGVCTKWIQDPAALAAARVIVIPGTKNTIADLHWLRSRGLDIAIIAAAKRGIPVIGICGGYQILGERLIDVDGVAGDAGDERGLGLFPMVTTFHREKTVRQVTATVGAHFTCARESPECGNGRTQGAPLQNASNPRRWTAYEIHMGRSEFTAPCEPLHSVEDAATPGHPRPEGARAGNVFGTYLHGWFEAPEVRAQIARAAKLANYSAHPATWSEKRQAIYSAMADHIDAHLNLDSVKRYLDL